MPHAEDPAPGARGHEKLAASKRFHMQSINPATGELLATWPYLDDAGVEAMLARSGQAASDWRRVSPQQRAAHLTAVAALLRQRKAEIARTITLEMGKPLAEAEAEVEKSAGNCDYVASQGPQWLADQPMKAAGRESYLSYLPLGPVLSILPWNFPVWQVFRCAASALMAGNTILLKHAPNVLGCADQVTRAFTDAGLPAGVFQNLNAPVSAIAGVIADPRVAAVTLTGSPAAGAKVAAQAGAACKKSVLELGGSDAFIVLADADVDAAVQAGIRARFSNCGQVCLAAKRFIVEAPIAAHFADAFAAAAASLRVGDPLQQGTQLGPMARADLRDGLDAQVRAARAAGARVLTGGNVRGGRGWFYEPTVMTGVDNHSPVTAQETFGPVAALMTARDAHHAIELANDSPFGLSAMLWTSDVDRARQLARALQVGGVFINGVTASDPRLPVGGVKLSGYGRELGVEGLRELCNIQTVVIS
jgi:acyl-CoA reductase-like NAD-dependent aldehyde dehydrogenase